MVCQSVGPCFFTGECSLGQSHTGSQSGAFYLWGFKVLAMIQLAPYLRKGDTFPCPCREPEVCIRQSVIVTKCSLGPMACGTGWQPPQGTESLEKLTQKKTEHIRLCAWGLMLGAVSVHPPLKLSISHFYQSFLLCLLNFIYIYQCSLSTLA